jgi:hypothetical protein
VKPPPPPHGVLESLGDCGWGLFENRAAKLARAGASPCSVKHLLVTRRRNTCCKHLFVITFACDQASQVTLSTLAQHQRELLHTLELETLRARAGSEAGLPIDISATSDQSTASAAGGSREIWAAPPAGSTYTSAVATFAQLGGQGRDLGSAEEVPAGRQRQRVEAAIGQATLEQKMEGLRLTMQRYATVGQELLGLQVEVARFVCKHNKHARVPLHVYSRVRACLFC